LTSGRQKDNSGSQVTVEILEFSQILVMTDFHQTVTIQSHKFWHLWSVTTVLALTMVMDGDHRVQIDCVDVILHVVYRVRNWLIAKVVTRFWIAIRPILQCCKRMRPRDLMEGNGGETQRLLG
jgi:hypothetical protein